MVTPPEDLSAVRFRNGKVLFLRASKLPAGEREAFVRREAAHDPVLAGEVLQLLERGDGEWSAELVGKVQGALVDGVRSMPERIGQYRIVAMLGQGGMGVVYRAERDDLKSHVAIKVAAPRIGVDSGEILARFELERRALAAMHHRCIARLFDAGTTEVGQPYFVMELVDGEPLTAACDRRRLPVRERLRLFQQVSEGVQHAHAKMVVHRDLKPGNVLVVDEGGTLVPKILDFGLAKALDPEHFAVSAAMTAAERPLGTLLYMSPEQAGGQGTAVDARSDIYSLGVMLYELLTGELPFPAEMLQRARAERGAAAVYRLLAETAPDRPSTRVSDSGDVRFADARRASNAALRSSLTGDLDWITLKALSKEPDQRYAAATALAEDIGRHLEHLPVSAGPPTLGYRLRKMLRRNRGQVIAVAAVLLTLLLGAIATGLQAVRAEQSNREFDQLSGLVLYDRAIAGANALHPPWPHQIEAMDHWLQGDCARLLAMRPAVERTVQTLRRSALPPTDAEQQAHFRAHSRFAEWKQLDNYVRSFRRAVAIHRGEQQLLVPQPSAEQVALDPFTLNWLAWSRAAFLQEREIYGQESLALALARLAVSGGAGTTDEPYWLDTLAWAYLWNGQLADARATMRLVMTKVNAADPVWQSGERRLETCVREIEAGVTRVEERRLALTRTIEAELPFRFAGDAASFLHGTLGRLLEQIDSLAANEKVAVERRLRWARELHDASHRPDARVGWDEARAAIAAADDVRASRQYAGQDIDLSDEVVRGLVPIGMNPVTRLWEFYDLRSAWDGQSNPRTIPLPTHRADGSIEVTDATGIVFVLLPGGTFVMGAQSHDPKRAHHDAAATDIELPNAMRLSPFFLARHEVTQAQWARLWNGADSLRYPSLRRAGTIKLTQSGETWSGEGVDGVSAKIATSNDPGLSGSAFLEITLAHPVERVDWPMCNRILVQHGMTLPTEAQWEYGCRAGTSTPWCCPLGELRAHANLAEASTAPGEGGDSGTDGHARTAPVGSFRANAFGLHDMHGNVTEWCLDWTLAYRVNPQPRSGLRLPIDQETARAAEAGSSSVEFGRSVRGGSFASQPLLARSSQRYSHLPLARLDAVGARAARPAWREPR